MSLLAHVLDNPSIDNDVPMVRKLSARFECEPLIPKDLDDARNLIASSRLLIGSRMHACLNSLSVGVPAVALSYSRKFSPLFAAISWWPAVELTGDENDLGRVMALAGEVQTDAGWRLPLTLQRAKESIDRPWSSLALRCPARQSADLFVESYVR